jgi:hypothetical protein
VCTLTFIETARGGVRLVHSRDEQRTRSAGLPPSPWTAGDYRLLSPRDPDAGGTWAALRDDGVILAVMNRNPEPPPVLDRSTLTSRGLLIESLAALGPSDLADGLRSIEAARYAPFRAFAAIPVGLGDNDHSTVHAAEWDHSSDTPNARPVVTEHAPPCCWPSSGLGDSVVADRLPLFEEMVEPAPSPEAQDAYHRHAWPGRGAASVFMSREDALTVSITTLESIPAGDNSQQTLRMTYLPLSPGPAIEDPLVPGEPVTETLEPAPARS